MNTLKRVLNWIFSWRGLVAVLVILFFVAPVIESWRVEALREGAISALEKKRGSRVIVLIHRQESVNVLGIPVVRYINIDDSEDVLRAIRFTDKNTPLDLILHTPGGLVLAASQRISPRRLLPRLQLSPKSCSAERCPRRKPGR